MRMAGSVRMRPCVLGGLFFGCGDEVPQPPVIASNGSVT